MFRGLAIRFIQSWLVQTDQSCGAFHPSLPCSRASPEGLSASSGNTCLSSLSAQPLDLLRTLEIPFAHCRSWLAVCLAWRQLSMAVYERDKVEQGLRERDHKPEPHLLPRWPPLPLHASVSPICSWKEWHMIPGSQSVRNIFVKYWEMVERAWETAFSLRGQITLHPMGKKLQTPGILIERGFCTLKKYLYFLFISECCPMKPTAMAAPKYSFK